MKGGRERAVEIGGEVRRRRRKENKRGKGDCQGDAFGDTTGRQSDV